MVAGNCTFLAPRSTLALLSRASRSTESGRQCRYSDPTSRELQLISAGKATQGLSGCGSSASTPFGIQLSAASKSLLPAFPSIAFRTPTAAAAGPKSALPHKSPVLSMAARICGQLLLGATTKSRLCSGGLQMGGSSACGRSCHAPSSSRSR